MRRLLIPTVCLLVLGFAVSAHAGALDKLFLDGGVNYVDDQDWEILINNVGLSPTVIDVGDYLFGMLGMQFIQDVEAPAPTPPNDVRTLSLTGDTFGGIFLLRVAAKSGGPTGPYTFTLAPAGAAAWTGLQGTYSNVPTVNNNGTVVAIYDESDGLDATTGGINGSIGTARNGATPLWELGFNSGVNFWTATTTSDDIANLTQIGNQFVAALNVTHTYAAAAGVPLLFHDWNGYGVQTQVQIFGSINPLAAQDLARLNGWTIGSDADFWIRPVPEPGSLALLGLGLLGLGGVVYRRRRK